MANVASNLHILTVKPVLESTSCLNLSRIFQQTLQQHVFPAGEFYLFAFESDHHIHSNETYGTE